MKYRNLGKTNLKVSEIGFGAWAIGGPAMAGNIPIGWGEIDDNESKKAILKAIDCGINFFDTADFYGLGHSEELLGETLTSIKSKNEIIIATKVGHELLSDGTINLNYSKNYILNACERSLKRLQRDYIDVYQLHSAKVEHLENGECIEAMEQLKKEGKIRFWGISLNTYNPEPEWNFILKNNLGDTIQVVLNVINQIVLDSLVYEAYENNYGIIARMPLQFGLLTGKFSAETKFDKTDHRSFRLKPEVIKISLNALKPFFKLEEKYKVDKTLLTLSFVLNHKEVSVVIPGIKTEKQAEINSREPIKFEDEDLIKLHELGKKDFRQLLEELKKSN